MSVEGAGGRSGPSVPVRLAGPAEGAADPDVDDRRRGGPAAWLRAVVPPLALALVVLVLWQGFVVVTATSELLLPSPAAVFGSLVDDADLFAWNAVVTVGEILVGFALGALVGVGLGVLLGYSRVVERSAYPWLVASQMVPVVAVAPILVVWFGFTLVPKVLVVALVSFFPVVVTTVDGLRSVDPQMIDLMRSLGAGRTRIMRSVRFPAALPSIFSGLRVAMALAVVGAVFGEWVGSSSGLGYLMLAFNNQLATADLFAAVVVLSVVGIALFFLVGAVQRILVPWGHARRGARR